MLSDHKNQEILVSVGNGPVLVGAFGGAAGRIEASSSESVVSRLPVGKDDGLSHLEINPYVQNVQTRVWSLVANGQSGQAMDLLIREIGREGVKPEEAQALFGKMAAEFKDRGYSDLANILKHNFPELAQDVTRSQVELDHIPALVA